MANQAFENMNAFIDDYRTGVRDITSTKLNGFYDPDQSSENLPERFTACEEGAVQLNDIGFPANANFSSFAALHNPANSKFEFREACQRGGINLTFDDPFETTDTTTLNVKNRHFKKAIATLIELGAIPDGTRLQSIVASVGGELTETRTLHYVNNIDVANAFEFDGAGALLHRKHKSYISTLLGIRLI